jgi:drug/metabolite transporter (DMT)-like permease
MSINKASTLLHYIVLLFGLLCIGWSAIFVKLADVTGFASAFYRMFFASVAVLPLWLFRKKKTLDKSSIKIAAFCGVLFACDIAMWNTSIMLSKAAIATLLANLSPVWVGMGAIFLYKEKTKTVFWIGTIVALFGVAVIVGIDKLYHTRLSYGNFLAICASVFYAAYLLTTQKARGTIDTVSFTAISMITSSIVLFIICTVANVPMLEFSQKSWYSLVGLGLISQFLGWLAINWSLGYIKSTSASVSLLSQSVITALIAIPVLGELLTWPEILGSIIVLFGVFLVNRRNLIKQQTIGPEYD